ncbi:hypothetical protein Tco_0106891, partial [Tanacetum coccineum]
RLGFIAFKLDEKWFTLSADLFWKALEITRLSFGIRPDLEPMQEDQTGSNSGKLHVSLAGPNPEHMDDEFLATAYPKKPSSLVTPPPINTEATTITTSLPEITPFIALALQLRVARLEQEMSEVKKTDHSADVLEQHTADLIEKYSVLPGLESIQNQESEKSPCSMDKEVADKVKYHKRKHDSDDDEDGDDDEGPSAGSNQ